MIGVLKHRISIEESIETPDGGGGFTTVWQKISDDPDIFAAVDPLSSSEQLRFQKLSFTATHRFTIRYREDVTAGQRLIFDGNAYNIVSLTATDANKRFLSIVEEKTT